MVLGKYFSKGDILSFIRKNKKKSKLIYWNTFSTSLQDHNKINIK